MFDSCSAKSRCSPALPTPTCTGSSQSVHGTESDTPAVATFFTIFLAIFSFEPVLRAVFSKTAPRRVRRLQVAGSCSRVVQPCGVQIWEILDLNFRSIDQASDACPACRGFTTMM
jgi:hypothetical protein